MNAPLARVSAFCGNIARQAKVRKRLLLVLGIFLFLQLYFVRELIAAELLFGLGFLVLAVLGGIFYLVGSIGERGFNLAETGAQALSPLARRGYAKLEEISKKPFRHPRSESAR
jgi:hypothetical protein